MDQTHSIPIFFAHHGPGHDWGDDRDLIFPATSSSRPSIAKNRSCLIKFVMTANSPSMIVKPVRQVAAGLSRAARPCGMPRPDVTRLLTNLKMIISSGRLYPGCPGISFVGAIPTTNASSTSGRRSFEAGSLGPGHRSSPLPASSAFVPGR